MLISAQPKVYTGGIGLEGVLLLLQGLRGSMPPLLQEAKTTSSANAASSRTGRGPAAILMPFLQ
jgi:hypothetical protein